MTDKVTGKALQQSEQNDTYATDEPWMIRSLCSCGDEWPAPCDDPGGPALP